MIIHEQTGGSLLYVDGDGGQNPPGVTTSNLIILRERLLCVRD